MKISRLLITSLLLAGCTTNQNSGGAPGEGTGAAADKPVELSAYSGTWQVKSFAGATQVDVKKVGNRYVGFADRGLDGTIEATVETRTSNGKILMEWDVDQNVESSSDITAECDVIEAAKEIRCTGWSFQPKQTFMKVSSAHLVEQRSGRSVGSQTSAAGTGLSVSGPGAAGGYTNDCWEREQARVASEEAARRARTGTGPSLCPSAKSDVRLYGKLYDAAVSCQVPQPGLDQLQSMIAQSERARDASCLR